MFGRITVAREVSKFRVFKKLTGEELFDRGKIYENLAESE
jgi:hypothetical protein